MIDAFVIMEIGGGLRSLYARIVSMVGGDANSIVKVQLFRGTEQDINFSTLQDRSDQSSVKSLARPALCTVSVPSPTSPCTASTTPLH
jgi:hypothetical protein